MWPWMQQPCRAQRCQAKQGRNEQDTESGTKPAVKIQNQRHYQRSDRRASLIKRFVQSENPASTDRFASIRKHRLNRWFADTATDAFRYDETRCNRPLAGKRERGHGEHVNGIPRERERPMPMRFVREISGDRAQPISQQLAEPRDKSDNDGARA